MSLADDKKSWIVTTSRFMQHIRPTRRGIPFGHPTERIAKVVQNLNMNLGFCLYETQNSGNTTQPPGETVVTVHHLDVVPELCAGRRLVHPACHSGCPALIIDKHGLEQFDSEHGDDDRESSIASKTRDERHIRKH
jgi:hypothetical protein